MTLPEPEAPRPLFVYGTLLDASFVGQLLQRSVAAEPARLLDYEVFELPGLSYPVIAAAPGSEIEGWIYRDLSAEDYRRLDAYEGVGEGLYRRIAAEVVAGGSAAGAGPEPACVYVATDQTLRRYG